MRSVTKRRRTAVSCLGWRKEPGVSEPAPARFGQRILCDYAGKWARYFVHTYIHMYIRVYGRIYLKISCRLLDKSIRRYAYKYSVNKQTQSCWHFSHSAQQSNHDQLRRIQHYSAGFLFFIKFFLGWLEGKEKRGHLLVPTDHRNVQPPTSPPDRND